MSWTIHDTAEFCVNRESCAGDFLCNYPMGEPVDCLEATCPLKCQVLQSLLDIAQCEHLCRGCPFWWEKHDKGKMIRTCKIKELK